MRRTFWLHIRSWSDLVLVVRQAKLCLDHISPTFVRQPSSPDSVAANKLNSPLLLNSIIALIPMSLPTIDEASWSMTLPLAFVIAGLSLLARHSFKFVIGHRSPRQIRRAE